MPPSTLPLIKDQDGVSIDVVADAAGSAIPDGSGGPGGGGPGSATRIEVSR